METLLIKLMHNVDVDEACAIADITAQYFLVQLDESADSDGLSALSTRLYRTHKPYKLHPVHQKIMIKSSVFWQPQPHFTQMPVGWGGESDYESDDESDDESDESV